MISKRFDDVNTAFLRSLLKQPKSEKCVYDLAEASFTCPGEVRVGGEIGDGGKFVCFTRAGRIRSQTDYNRSCLVYSLGSNMNFKFEQDVFKRTQCVSYTFDPTIESLKAKAYLEENRMPYINFHSTAICADKKAKKIKGKTYTCQSIASVMEEHDHHHLDLLKIDIEGSEFEVVPELLNSVVRPSQIFVEMHGTNWKKIRGFFEKLFEAGYVLFHKERNHWGCDGFRCVEFSFASRAYLCNSGWTLPASISCDRL